MRRVRLIRSKNPDNDTSKGSEKAKDKPASKKRDKKREQTSKKKASKPSSSSSKKKKNNVSTADLKHRNTEAPADVEKSSEYQTCPTNSIISNTCLLIYPLQRLLNNRVL